ncbi:GMC family oxidoreductase [Caballeronia concitans]|uniref:Sorbose dehydrogenase n=1 Tax=Caballeronia concitans TaxID=1777133 RepID=A0A658QUU9_9BURK|nr:GMC family oxidoreductase N-terminal domain-containing protein [Caballeronia concitans]KIG10908.1 Choline dehydrogenase [Burkholderia sp. MR1]SAL24119.1 sorbose dehydrogenase [Caballeronia concitans]
MDRFDYVIVGGGSAGCVLAHRLSAAPSVRVALIEAGADTPPGAVPAAILDSYPMPVFCGDTYIWPDLKAKATKHAAPRVYEQGRVMGGGSSINVQSANRGLPRDYDDWAANGADGWSWRDVLPYFRKLERDVNFPGGELHGSDGPVPIRRIMPKDWPAFCHAFAKGMRANGLAELQDQNGEFGDGFFPGAFSNIDDARVSTAIAYLDEATRKRPNLSVHANLRVERIVMEGAAARGVVAIAGNGERVHFEANEVVLCAGALQSPAMLLRAGIGDARELAAQGIACTVDVPGVGRNLQDHPSLTFCHFLEPRFRMPLARRRASMTAARMSSGVAGCDDSDLYLSSATRAAWHALGNRLGLFFLWCNRPYSRGRVQLASPDAAAAPRVDLNLLDDERDLQRLAVGVRMLARIVDASGLGRDPRDFFPAAFSPRVKALSRVGDGNALLTSMLGVLLDTPAPLRRLLIERFFTRGLKMSALINDDRALDDFIRANVFGVWHASGTCRMGGPQDRDAVTDTEGRVRGTQGLRVVDASLMPRLPSANTNIPTIMIAEKIADAMVAGRRAGAESRIAAAH